jgi:hypothetical protein
MYSVQSLCVGLGVARASFLDIFSRYVVGWMLAYRESAELV